MIIFNVIASNVVFILVSGVQYYGSILQISVCFSCLFQDDVTVGSQPVIKEDS
jgi:hypothetical protein